MRTLDDWSSVGDRVRAARVAGGYSQTELAEAIGADRTAVGRVESGDRRLTLLEASALAEKLAIDLSVLLAQPLPAVTSHRRSPVGESRDDQRGARASLLVEQHARDTTWLVEGGFLRLPPSAKEGPDRTRDLADPATVEQAARDARARAGVGPVEPIGALAETAEALGVFMLGVDEDIEGASLLVGDYSVAVVGARTAPGRRRMTGAHEVGHQVLGDEYSVDVGVSASTDQREQVIDRFATELLIPGVAVTNRLQGLEGSAVFDALARLAAEFRVSWTVALQRALDVGAVSRERKAELSKSSPTRGDFLRLLGREVPEDLEPGSAGPRWTTAVLDAYADGQLGEQRAIRLLGGRFQRDQLPRRPDDDLW